MGEERLKEIFWRPKWKAGVREEWWEVKNIRRREEGKVRFWEGDEEQTWVWALPGVQSSKDWGRGKCEMPLSWVFEASGILALTMESPLGLWNGYESSNTNISYTVNRLNQD